MSFSDARLAIPGAAADKLQINIAHLNSQMKLSEAIAAEHDELITKFHESNFTRQSQLLLAISRAFFLRVCLWFQTRTSSVRRSLS